MLFVAGFLSFFFPFFFCLFCFVLFFPGEQENLNGVRENKQGESSDSSPLFQNVSIFLTHQTDRREGQGDRLRQTDGWRSLLR